MRVTVAFILSLIVFSDAAVAEFSIDERISGINNLANDYAVGNISEVTLHYKKEKLEFDERPCDLDEFEEGNFKLTREFLEEKDSFIERYKSTVEKRLRDDIFKMEEEFKAERSRPDSNYNHLLLIHDYANRESTERVVTYYSFNNPGKRIAVILDLEYAHFEIWSEDFFLHREGYEIKNRGRSDREISIAERKRSKPNEEGWSLAAEEFQERCVLESKNNLARFRTMDNEGKMNYFLEEFSDDIDSLKSVPDYISEPIEGGEGLGVVEPLGNNIQFVIGNDDVNFITATTIIKRDEGTIGLYTKELRGEYDTLIKVDPYFLLEFKLLARTDAGMFSIGYYVGKSLLSGKIVIKPIWRIAKIVSVIKFVDNSNEFYHGLISSINND